MRRPSAWLLAAFLSVCCANGGELEDQPEVRGGSGPGGNAGSGNTSFAGNAGTVGVGGSAGVGGLSGPGGASGTSGQGGAAGSGGTGGQAGSAGSGGAAGSSGAGGNAGAGPLCPSEQKLCGASCVSASPGVGCGATGCDPCSTPANATAKCNGGNCDFDCNGGYTRTGNSCVPECVPASCPQVCPLLTPWACCQANGSCGCRGLITPCHTP
ncbi:MAG TPA: hypothetical protein VK524_32040 [Polyangiaceae bacterium]|nr:hypothetical protein [Polyangiaceae bacterium]